MTAALELSDEDIAHDTIVVTPDYVDETLVENVKGVESLSENVILGTITFPYKGVVCHHVEYGTIADMKGEQLGRKITRQKK